MKRNDEKITMKTKNGSCYFCGTFHGDECPEFPTSPIPRLRAPLMVVLGVVLLALLTALSFSGCAHVTPEPGGPSCQVVCDRAEKMGCSWAAPTPAGATCAVVCLNAEEARVPWKTACLAEIASCDEPCP